MYLDKERERSLRITVMGKADLTCGNHFNLLPINHSNEKSKEILDLHGMQRPGCLTLVCTTGCRGISATAPGVLLLLLPH